MLYLALMLSTCLAAGKSVLFKKIGVDFKSTAQFLRLNALSFATAALVALSISGFDFKSLAGVSPFSAMMACLFALSIITTYLAQCKALSLGTTSSTMMIYSCGFLIPVFFSAAVYGETVSAVDGIALLLLLMAIFLIITPKKNARLSFKWILLSVISMIGSGTTAILQKVHQRSLFADEFLSMSVCEFLIAGVLLFLLSTVLPKKEISAAERSHEWKIGVLNGVFLGALSLLNLKLSGKLPAIVVFPVYNVGNIILSGLLGAVLYREKNTKKEILGFAVGCVAILMLGIL
ncbi:MAG: EamA family transporter [Clostridia bacterium]|nr:EamA family transporter [Clostridia bacterium]